MISILLCYYIIIYIIADWVFSLTKFHPPFCFWIYFLPVSRIHFPEQQIKSLCFRNAAINIINALNNKQWSQNWALGDARLTLQYLWLMNIDWQILGSWSPGVVGCVKCGFLWDYLNGNIPVNVLRYLCYLICASVLLVDEVGEQNIWHLSVNCVSDPYMYRTII